MNVAEDLDRRVDSEHHRLRLKHLLRFISQGQNVFATERKVGLTVDRGAPLLWTQQMVEEELAERFQLLAARLTVLVVGYLSNLSLFAFDLGLAELNLHVTLREGLHGRRDRSAARLRRRVSLASTLSLRRGLLELLNEACMSLHMLHHVQLHDGVRGHIRCIVLEATVHENGLRLWCPD